MLGNSTRTQCKLDTHTHSRLPTGNVLPNHPWCSQHQMGSMLENIYKFFPQSRLQKPPEIWEGGGASAAQGVGARTERQTQDGSWFEPGSSPAWNERLTPDPQNLHTPQNVTPSPPPGSAKPGDLRSLLLSTVVNSSRVWPEPQSTQLFSWFKSYVYSLFLVSSYFRVLRQTDIFILQNPPTSSREDTSPRTDRFLTY